MDSNALSSLLRECLLTDVQVNKPGNVSMASAGHGMVAEDFIRSAELITPVLCDRRYTTGQRMEKAVELTQREVGCNTNLGLILLCTPLIVAAERGYEGDLIRLRHRLAQVLRELHGKEGGRVFTAIRMAAPGGLGESARFDVRFDNSGNVRSAMAHACARDRIAWQYCSIFHDIFIIFLSVMCDCMRYSGDMEKAVLTCYIDILSRYPDSHIERQHGASVALRVQDEAKIIRHNTSNLQHGRKMAGSTQSLDDFD